MSLDERGILAGTDKSSLANDYLRHYERIFAPWQQRKFALLEIGIAQGGSLGLWRDYFPKATIVGVDINPTCKRFEEPRIRVEIGSQDDPEFLLRLCNGMQPGIIIDDGSHRADHIKFTFERLFPHLLPGGLYVIEDLYLHFGDSAKTYRGNAVNSVPEMISNLSVRLMSGRSGAEESGFEAYLSRTVDRIEIVGRSVVIGKKEPERTIDWQAMFKLVEESGSHENWHHLSTLVMSRQGPRERGVEASRRAVAADPKNHAYRIRLASLLHQAGDLEGAIGEAEEALRLGNLPEGHPLHAFLKDLKSARSGT